jgi:hypothetical protein
MPGASQATITINPAVRYQTMTGWEAVAQAAQEIEGFALYKDTLFDLVVGDLGINRLRVEIGYTAENTRDYWSEFRAGLIDRESYRFIAEPTVNDNDDPLVINWAGFQFASLDYTIENVVLPMKQRLEARGERLFINLNYVSFTSRAGPGLRFYHSDPEEYAEFVLATYLHLKDRYGLVPDAWEVVLEPDNVPQWNPTAMGQAIAAAARRLEANGFTPYFIAPSTTNMGRAPVWFDQIIRVPGVSPHLKELSYHRYQDASRSNLDAIASRAVQHGVATSMLEHIGSGYEALHEDLKVGRASAWQQYTLAFPESDNGAQYYVIDRADPAQPVLRMGSRTPFLRQYFRYIRSGAVRIEATTSNPAQDPLAFINPDGSWVVVVRAARSGEISVGGLPAGTYGIRYTTASAADVNPGDVAINGGDSLVTQIPAAGVLTLFRSSPT